MRVIFQSNFSICILTQSLNLILVLGELPLVMFPNGRLSQSYSSFPATTVFLYLSKETVTACQAGTSTVNTWKDTGTNAGGEGCGEGLSELAWHLKASALFLRWTQRVGLSCAHWHPAIYNAMSRKNRSVYTIYRSSPLWSNSHLAVVIHRKVEANYASLTCASPGWNTIS